MFTRRTPKRALVAHTCIGAGAGSSGFPRSICEKEVVDGASTERGKTAKELDADHTPCKNPSEYD
jgi:hypothetical protein